MLKKTKQVPCEANPQQREAFLAELQGLLDKKQEENTVFYYMDAVHPTHNTRSLYGWIAQGQDYALLTVSGRDRVNINGAINAHNPVDVIVETSERINAD